MSLPFPSSGGQNSVNPRVVQAMEPALIDLAQKSGGDLRTLLYAFFSFLHRRTDFYVVMDGAAPGTKQMGFREGDAEKLLLAAFRQFPLRKIKAPNPTAATDAVSSNKSNEAEKNKVLNEAKEPKVSQDEKTTATEKSTKKKPDATAKKSPQASTAAASSTENAADDTRPRLTEEGLQIPEGNGGATKRYRWTQTLEETTVVLAVPQGSRGKDLDVTLKSTLVSVKMKKTTTDDTDTPKFLLEGTLVDKINVQESTWSLEGGALLLMLQKVKHTWWDTVIQGDDRIDTSLVDSSRRIDTYDESTQGAIRKILFDQRQERLGLPSSDQLLREQGQTPPVPPMPPGVEYIDKDTLENAEKQSK